MPSADASPLNSISFRLAMLGKVATAAFAARIAPDGLRPHLVALLGLVAEGPVTQSDAARRLGVVPSAVVDAADALQGLGALERVRDTSDRRRSLLQLTTQGRRLLQQSASQAHAVDEHLTRNLTPAQRQTLHALLRQIDDPATP